MRSSRRFRTVALLAVSGWLAVAAWLAQPAVAAIVPVRPQCWPAGDLASDQLVQGYDDILRECIAELASVPLILPDCDNTSADSEQPSRPVPTSSDSSLPEWLSWLVHQSVVPGGSAAASPNSGSGGPSGGTAPAALTGAPGWCEPSLCRWLCPQDGQILRSNGLKPPTPPPRG